MAIALSILATVKNLHDSTSFVGYLQHKKHHNILKKAIISPFFSTSRSYIGNLRSLSPGIVSSETHPILQSSEFQHWFKSWKHLRERILTASTFGLAVGFWRGRRVQLWLEKLGVGETKPFSGNLATSWSNIKEKAALERYQEITGNTVSYPNFQVKKNPENNWLGASPDGIVDSFIDGYPSHGVLEIKCPFFRGKRSIIYPWKRVPLYYIPQAQGLMEILDRDWLDMYCWTVNGSSLFRIHRDPEYWDVLNIALSDFWWKHVQPAKEICNRSVITNPRIELKSLRPAPKHELWRQIVYGSKIIVDNSNLLWREIHGKRQN